MYRCITLISPRLLKVVNFFKHFLNMYVFFLTKDFFSNYRYSPKNIHNKLSRENNIFSDLCAFNG